MRYNSFVCALAALSVTACNTEHGPDDPGNSKWISRVVEYRPAPGQFINTFQGNVTAAEGIVGGRNGCLSLGGFGGYVIFEFDHEVRNIDGTDFVISATLSTAIRNRASWRSVPTAMSGTACKVPKTAQPEPCRTIRSPIPSPPRPKQRKTYRGAITEAGGEPCVPLRTIPSRTGHCFCPEILRN